MKQLFLLAFTVILLLCFPACFIAVHGLDRGGRDYPYESSRKPTGRIDYNPAFQKVMTGYGPEDMVLDTACTPPRLLISCCARRTEYPEYGEIESFEPLNGKRTVLKRTGEPAGLVLQPHGISLVTAGEIQYLYVISHNDQSGVHPVIRYQVEADSLVFVDMLSSKLLVSPNALHAFPDGSLYVCNDAGARNDMKEKIFRQKKGNVVHYDGRGNWTIAARELGMPAGLTGFGNHIYVSAALENKLYSYLIKDHQLIDKKEICQIKGPDNIRIHGDKLLVTSHARPLRFIRHVKTKTRHSPSLILAVDPVTGNTEPLFSDDGRQINAASVAIIFNHQLIIGQIFEPFILVNPVNR